MIVTIILGFALGVAVGAYGQSRARRPDPISLLGLSVVYGLAAVGTAAFWVFYLRAVAWVHVVLWLLLTVGIVWLVRRTDWAGLARGLRENLSWRVLVVVLILVAVALLSRGLVYADMLSPRGDDVKRHAGLVYLLNHLDAIPTSAQMDGYVWDVYLFLGFHVLIAAFNEVLRLLPADLIQSFVVLLPAMLALVLYRLCLRAFGPIAAVLAVGLVLHFGQIPNEILFHSNYVFFLGMIYAVAFVGSLVEVLRDQAMGELPGMVLCLTGLFLTGSFVQEFLFAAPALLFLFVALRRPTWRTMGTLVLVAVAVAVLALPEIVYLSRVAGELPPFDSRQTIQAWGIFGQEVGGIQALPWHFGVLASLLTVPGAVWVARATFAWWRRRRSGSREGLSEEGTSLICAWGLFIWAAFTLGYAILASVLYIPLPGILYTRAYKQMFSVLPPVVALVAQGGAVLLARLSSVGSPRLRSAGAAALVAFAIGSGVLNDVRFWYPLRIEPVLHRHGRRLLEWMDTNLEDGEWVLNNFRAADTSSWIPAFTGNRAVISDLGGSFPNRPLKEELRYNVGTNPNGHRSQELLELLDVSYIYVGGHRTTLDYERGIVPFNPAELMASPYYELVAQDGNNFLFATPWADEVPAGYRQETQVFEGYRNPLFHLLTPAHLAGIRADQTFVYPGGQATYTVRVQAGPIGGRVWLRMDIYDATVHTSAARYASYAEELSLAPFAITDVAVAWDYWTGEATFLVDGRSSSPDVVIDGDYDEGFEYVVCFALAGSAGGLAFDQYDTYVYLWEDFTRPTTLPEDVGRPLGANLDDRVTLAGYSLSSDVVHPGEALAVTLTWQAESRMDRGYTVFVHLFDPGGNRLWGQHDSQPRGGTYPTDWWIEDEVVTDVVTVQVDPATPPGDYELRVGMYWLPTGERLPLAGEGGDSVLLTTIRVED